MASQFRCPRCGAGFRTLTDEPGRDYMCPHCEHRIRFAGEAEVAPRPVARPGGGIELDRRCPRCGTRYPCRDVRCPGCGLGWREAKIEVEDARREAARTLPGREGVNAGVVGGIALIAIAAAWFFAGLAVDLVFYYPPILAAIGLVAILKGLATGNLTEGRRRRRYARRPAGGRRRRR